MNFNMKKIITILILFISAKCFSQTENNFMQKNSFYDTVYFKVVPYSASAGIVHLGIDTVAGSPTFGKLVRKTAGGGSTSTLQQVFNTEVGGSVLNKPDTVNLGVGGSISFLGGIGLAIGRTSNFLFDVGRGVYGFLTIDSTNRQFNIGDLNGIGNSTYMNIDDPNQNIDFNANGAIRWGADTLATLSDVRAIAKDISHARATAQTSANTNVLTYTTGAADGTFQISANVLVTASSTHSFTVTVDYTDEGNTARTVTLTFSQLAGTFITAITNVTGAAPYEGVPLTIRTKGESNIVFKTAGTFTTVTYNVDANIMQLN